TIPSIVESLFREWGIPCSFKIDAARYPILDTRFQYGETDFDFVRRLLEEAGIPFYFPANGRRGSKLVVHDHLPSEPARGAPPIPYFQKPPLATDVEFVTRVRWSYDVRHDAHTVRDHDFRNPSFGLFGQAPKSP